MQNEQVVFSMSVVMGTRAREEGDKIEEAVWFIVNDSGAESHRANNSKMSEKVQTVAWLGVRSDGPVVEGIEEKAYDKTLF